MDARNVLLSAAVFAAATAWTAFWCHLQKRRLVSRNAVRKVIHMSGAPIMALSWPLYRHPCSLPGRISTSLVPLAFAARLLLSYKADPLCTSISRSGDNKESRGGPLAYCLAVFASLALAGPCSVVPYAVVAAFVGDGMAAIVGSKVGGPAWPMPKSWHCTKTVCGTLTFALCCVVSGLGLQGYAAKTGLLSEAATMSSRGMSWLAILCAAVEVLPFEDNVTVPAVATLVARAAK